MNHTNEELNKITDYRVIANSIDTIAVMCAGNPDKIIDLLSKYLWNKEEVEGIKDALNKDDFSAKHHELYFKSIKINND